jgi:tripartite-type tricarboxylate transporter receptor subunit TctC
MIAQSLSTQLKQSFVVEDVGGGGAIIGSEKVARAAPDGYTLLVTICRSPRMSRSTRICRLIPLKLLHR